MSAHDEHTPSGGAEPQAARPGAVLIGFLVLLAGMSLILFQSGVRPFKDGILPEAISTYADDIDMLFWVIMGITGFFFVLTQGLLIYFCVKYRAKDGEPRKARHTHGHHGLELAWTFIPGLILFALAVFQTGTWGDVKFRKDFPEKGESPYEVRVMGLQFNWVFWIPGPDGQWDTGDDVATKDELHVPANRPVFVYLQTKDVLHSFWLPNVRLKQDLVPGQTIPQWFEIRDTEEQRTTGREFQIVCAELCGNGHTNMGARMYVKTDEALDEWIAGMAGTWRGKSAHADLKFWRESNPESE